MMAAVTEDALLSRNNPVGMLREFGDVHSDQSLLLDHSTGMHEFVVKDG